MAESDPNGLGRDLADRGELASRYRQEAEFPAKLRLPLEQVIMRLPSFGKEAAAIAPTLMGNSWRQFQRVRLSLP